MLGKAAYVVLFALPVALVGVIALQYRLPVGPVVLALALLPLAGLLLAGRALVGALPDILFGAIDTGLLTVPALWGGIVFGVAGAIAGGVIGDALTDAVAGFVEGGLAQWLEQRGIRASREAVTTALGKMCGCLMGSGLILSAAALVGLHPAFP